VPLSLRSRWIGRAALAALLIVPAAAAVASPLQVGRELSWVFGALAGVVALSLLTVQVLLPTSWLDGLLVGRDRRWHRTVGLVIVGIVLAHVAGLYVYSPDDVRDALVLAAPTYSRLGVLSAWSVGLSVTLALGRRRLGLTHADWQILHSTLAVAVVTTAVGHAVMVRGTLDGPAELLVCGAALVAVSAAVVYQHLLRPLRRRPGRVPSPSGRG
jgi:Ferric reductase like transmembrane component